MTPYAAEPAIEQDCVIIGKYIARKSRYIPL
jgi:hypothetical protein